MRRPRLTVLAVVLALGSGYETALAVSLGTAFTYQGRLKEGGVPANDEHDFIFRLFDDPVGGAQVGGDVEIDEWLVSDGLFTVELDFGTDVFTGDALWLQVGVRLDGEYIELSPRQPLNATPYALYALSGPGGGGFWAANGDDIYNTNSGNVGVGTSSPLEKLHVAGSVAALRLQDDDDAESYTSIYDVTSGMLRLEKFTSVGDALMDISPRPQDALSGATVRFFRRTNTTGPKVVVFNRGDGTTGASALIGVDGYDSWFQADGGNFGIGTSEPICKLDVRETDPAIAAAVSGHHTNGYGVKGVSDEGIGVIGFGSQQGVYGWGLGEGAVGVFGIGLGEGGYAGYFTGRGCFMGDLGVNVQEPEAALDVLSFTGQTGVRAVTSGTGVYGLHDASSGTFPGVWGATNSLTNGASGVRGYVNSTTPGTASAGVRGHNNGTTMSGYGVHGSHDGYGNGVNGVSANGTGVYAKSTNGWALYAETENGATAARFVGNVEIVSPSTGLMLIEFGEGLDYAEGFDVSDESKITPGTVLVIDAENAGELAISRAPYDRKVAGIVAGANGLGSAVRLGAGQYDFDVALAGRVYCNVDASYGAVQAGDLLTTSPTPGYAMKVTDHEKAQGAILGKAMQPLKQGEKGQILVLVTLQ